MPPLPSLGLQSFSDQELINGMSLVTSAALNVSVPPPFYNRNLNILQCTDTCQWWGLQTSKGKQFTV